MKISLSQNQWFDGEGKPLSAGRISVYVHGSNVPKDIFTLDSHDNYTQASNPFILDDAGRAPTLWFEASTVDVLVEAYNGVPGSYDQVDTYQDGFDMPDVRNDTVAYGISGLQDTNTELGTVTVVGFNNGHDCGARTFVWDPMATETEDGCAIVASNSVAEGRWILLSDSRYMPSEWYGIVPGSDEGNISAFLTYPETVGQWHVKLPPVPRFTRGTYTSAGVLTSTKTIAFDTGARFTGATFMCYAAEVAYNPSYVADFQFIKQDFADSSWFRTAKRFWKCQAYELHQAPTNYFTDNSVGSYGTTCAILSNQRISGQPLTLSGQAVLQFEHCDIADYSLSTLWNTVFKSCDFTDRWFNDAAWDFGTDISHRQRVRSTENRVVLDNFADANVYLWQQAANGATAIDLQGRPVSTITGEMPFTYIGNAVIGYAHFTHSITLDRCTVNHLYLDSNSIDVLTKGCNFVLDRGQCNAWNDNGSSFTLDCDIDTTYAAINWVGSLVTMAGHRIGRAEDDLYSQKSPVFWDCTINGGVIASSHPVMLGCNIADTPVYVYPYAFLENLQQSWAFGMEFRDNRFNAGSYIAIGGNNGLSDHLSEVYECKVNSISITGNVFNTTSRGITCPFWSGTSLAYRFVRGLSSYVTGDATDRSVDYFPVLFLYKDNSGNCPREFGPSQNENLPGNLAAATGWATGAETAMYFCRGVRADYVFCMPAMENAGKTPLPDPAISGGLYEVSGLSVCTAYRMKALLAGGVSGGHCVDFPTAGYLPCCAYDKSLPNDMFYVLAGVLGANAQFYGVNPQPSGE